MRQIRRNTFETNSSSTHAFAFVNDKNNEIDFENYEDFITPYLREEDIKIEIPIHKFETVHDMLRYFYTQYRFWWQPESKDDYYEYTPLYEFMQLIMQIFPKVTFDLDTSYDAWKDLMYFEDADWVFNNWDECPDDLYNQVKDAETMKKFFNEGIIYFGSRDYYGDFDPWETVWKYNKNITKIASVTG